MAEPMSGRLAEGDRPADRPLSQDDGRWRRYRGEFGSVIFLVALAIIGIASAVSLFAASFALLTHPRPAGRPATPSVAQRTTAMAPRDLVKQGPSEPAA